MGLADGAAEVLVLDAELLGPLTQYCRPGWMLSPLKSSAFKFKPDSEQAPTGGIHFGVPGQKLTHRYSKLAFNLAAEITRAEHGQVI
jgi:hypothetical protein